MGTDQETVAASPCVAQLEEIIEAMQEPFQMPEPFGLPGDSNWLVATDMRTSEARFTIPVQEETIETQELSDAFKSVEIKLGELVDAKRPLASTVEMPKEETMLTNIPATEEPVVQAVKEPVVQIVKEPVVQSVKEPAVQNCEGTCHGSTEETNHVSSIGDNRVTTIDKTQRINL